MSPDPLKDTEKLDRMLRWTLKQQPGRRVLQTGFKPEDLRAMGIHPQKGHYYRDISDGEGLVTFEIMPRRDYT